MRLSSIFSSIASLPLISANVAGYGLVDDISPANFLDVFGAFTGKDPTKGFVDYTGVDEAKARGMLQQSSSSVRLGVDTADDLGARGRRSLRFESKKNWNEGLFIADFAHVPSSDCGLWPAFWTLGEGDWPYSGEIDIYEGVNDENVNQVALHTQPGCELSTTGGVIRGEQTPNNDCNAFVNSNAGCTIRAGSDQTSSYGTGFNSAGGGVYALEWTKAAISVWHFQRSVIPADVKTGKPNPSAWGPPQTRFQLSCSIADNFKNHRLVINTAICGEWAGNVWNKSPKCASMAPTCEDHVKQSPGNIWSQAYWEINSIKVYQSGDGFIGQPGVPGQQTGTPVPSATGPSVAPPAPKTMTIPAYGPPAASSVAAQPAKPTLMPYMNEALAAKQPQLRGRHFAAAH